ncbi:MAG: hypothetical protein JWM05_2572, partial [Acidimicrobiales bacterium]|nr:hypothetical protein [Acidimicrobiales bacterium]
SATVTVVLMPLASGIYQIPVVTSSDTADPDAADRIVTDTVIVKKGPSQAVRYIHGLFKLLLGRDASAGDATYWSAKFLKASYFQRYEIPLGVMASKEYRAIRIKEAYLRILERAASPDDVDFSAALIAKGETYAHLERRLVASAEFATHHPGTAIVDAIFKVVLRRPPNQSERSHWADALSSGRRSVDQMTAALQTSNESFELIMRTRLKEALDRAPFALDRFSWQLQLRRGVSPERLYADTLGGEFLQKFPPTYDNIGCCFYGAAPTL